MTVSLRRIMVGAMICCSSTAFSACLPSADQASKEELNYFQINPNQVVLRAQRDSDRLAQMIGRYVGTDVAALAAVKSLLRTAPARYKIAVGAGLELANQRCVGANPSWSAKIQSFVDELQDLDVSSGYRMSIEPQALRPAAIRPTDRLPWVADNPSLPDAFKPIPLSDPNGHL